MPAPIPDHLLDQAALLSNPKNRGAPRQADLRRAVSTAYYALFHAIMTALADEFIGRQRRNSNAYRLAYRLTDHKALRDLGSELGKTTPSARYQAHWPGGGFGIGMQDFAGKMVSLQKMRHAADYDPSHRETQTNAAQSVAAARSAISSFEAASGDERRLFLTMLAFPPR